MDALTKGFMQTQRCDKRLILRHYTVKSYSYRYTLRERGRNGRSVSSTPPSSSSLPFLTLYTRVSFSLPLSGANLTINIDLELGGLFPGVFPFRSNTYAILYCVCFFTLLSYIVWRGGSAVREFVDYALLLSGIFICV